MKENPQQRKPFLLTYRICLGIIIAGIYKSYYFCRTKGDQILTMSYDIQPSIFCENCIKCGTRPVIDQTKKDWVIKCPNDSCKNSIAGPFVDFDTWNRVNKKNPNLKPKPGSNDLMQSA